MLAELTNRRVYMTLRSLHGKTDGAARVERGMAAIPGSRIQSDENLPDLPVHASAYL